MSTITKDYVTALHNLFAKVGQATLVTYAESSVGPSSEAIWTAECKIAGEVRGIGVARQKATAKQMAAKQALDTMQG